LKNEGINEHKDMTFEDYEGLFAEATPAHDFVGEASTSYLLHGPRVLPKLLEYSADARFLVCVRNPIEMAFSLHQERVFNNEEDVDDFVAAWAQPSPHFTKLQRARRKSASG
jgi:hypothetical protein